VPATEPRSGPRTELRLPRNRRPVPTRTRLTTRRLPVVAYAVLLILLPVLGVTGSMAAGWWSTTGRAATAASGATWAGEPGAGSTVAAKPADVGDVKGATTVRQVADAFPPVTAAEIVAAFGAPAGTPPSAQLKTLVESGNGMEIPAFRIWLEKHRAP
jgi:hypothetical protein